MGVFDEKSRDKSTEQEKTIHLLITTIDASHAKTTQNLALSELGLALANLKKVLTASVIIASEFSKYLTQITQFAIKFPDAVKAAHLSRLPEVLNFGFEALKTLGSVQLHDIVIALEADVKATPTNG
jgi:hypothetical protein